MNYGLYDVYLGLFFSIAITRGSGLGTGGQDRTILSDSDIREFIATEVVVAIQSSIPYLFGSIKTTMIKIVDDFYTTLVDAAATATATIVAVGIRGERSFKNWDFDNM